MAIELKDGYAPGIYKTKDCCCSTFPPPALSVIRPRAVCEGFVEHGKLRFSPLARYCTIDNTSRRDPSEGEGYAYFHDGERLISMSTGSGNCRYIMCCTCPPEDKLRLLMQKFGAYVVKINGPQQLAKGIGDYFLAQDDPPFVLECVPIKYLKGQVLDREPDNETTSQLSWTYKPPAYAEEHEWRYVLVDKPRGEEDEFTEDILALEQRDIR